MDAIKFTLKWTGVFLVGLFVLSRCTAWNMQQDERAYTITRKAIADKRALIGMTPAEVEQAWGKPDRISKGAFDRVEVEQWYYDATPPRYDDGRYVGFREGKAAILNAGVTATQ